MSKKSTKTFLSLKRLCFRLVFSFFVLIFANLGQTWSASDARASVICQNLFSDSVDTRFVDTHEIWTATADGMREWHRHFYGMDNLLRFLTSAILAGENFLLDAPGGGSKTKSLRSVFESQLAALRTNPNSGDSNKLYKDMQVFVLQMRQALSEVKIIGGPNPFKVITESDYSLDISGSLIDPANLYAILDELEKAPVYLQMILLSILQEREALAGNEILKTSLETIAATTNASHAQLISQATPREVGGRMALLDRFAVKFHTVSTPVNGQDLGGLIEVVRADEHGTKKRIWIDLKGLKPLLQNVSIPDEIAVTAADIAMDMDQYYTSELSKAYKETIGTALPPQYFPPFLGSTRSHGKVIPLLKAAFIVRQLMSSVPFEMLRLNMTAADLINLDVALLHGSSDAVENSAVRRVYFRQRYQTKTTDNNLELVLYRSNSNNPAFIKEQISVGTYDPFSSTFSYTNTRGQKRRVYFNSNTGQLEIQDSEIKAELLAQNIEMGSSLLSSRAAYLDDINLILRRHAQRAQTHITSPSFQFPNSTHRPLARIEEKQQYDIIASAAQQFASVLNTRVGSLSAPNRNTADTIHIDINAQAAAKEAFKRRSLELQMRWKIALRSNNITELNLIALESLKALYDEANAVFLDSTAELEVMLTTIGITAKNVLDYSGPGSGKTQKMRLLFDAALKGLHTTSEYPNLLAQYSILRDPQYASKAAAFIKQVSPMTPESDFLGRTDVAALANNQGFRTTYNNSLADPRVHFVGIDEADKASDGTKAALLAPLNERETLDGNGNPLNIIAMFLLANAIPYEFLQGFGNISTALPVWDRLHRKAYALNKLERTATQKFYLMVNHGFVPELVTPYFFMPLREIAKTFHFNTMEQGLESMLHEIHIDILSVLIKESETQRAAHLKNPQAAPYFYLQTRGESSRSAVSIFGDKTTDPGELAAEVLAQRVFNGEDVHELAQKPLQFKIKDLVAFANLYVTANPLYKFQIKTSAEGIPEIEFVQRVPQDLIERLSDRDLQMIRDHRFEFQTVASIINKHLRTYFDKQIQMILKFPDLFPNIFLTREQRIQWLISNGVSPEQVRAQYGPTNN